MVGGIGSCGLTLCCTTWLPEFVPVSIKMAKDQGLVLSPTKVSGQCGRLKCCLVYEQAALRRDAQGPAQARQARGRRARRRPRRRGRRAAPARPRVVRPGRHRGLARGRGQADVPAAATSRRRADEPEPTTRRPEPDIRRHDHALLHHDADLLRQRRAAPRARVHDDRRRRARALPPHARRRHALPHRHRRARPEDRGGREEARADAAAARRQVAPRFDETLEDARHLERRFIRTTERATQEGRRDAVEAHPRAQPGRPLPRDRTRAGTASAARRSTPRASSSRTATTLAAARSTRRRSTGSTRSAAGSSGCRGTPSRCSRTSRRTPTFIRPERTATRSSSFLKGGLQGPVGVAHELRVGHPGARGRSRGAARTSSTCGWTRSRTTCATCARRRQHRRRRTSSSSGRSAIHVIGKDILRFHAVYWPAFLMAARAAAAEDDLRARLVDGARREDLEVDAGDAHRSDRARRRARRSAASARADRHRRDALLPAARGAARPRRRLHVRVAVRPLQRRARERPRQPRQPQPHADRQVHGAAVAGARSAPRERPACTPRSIEVATEAIAQATARVRGDGAEPRARGDLEARPRGQPLRRRHAAVDARARTRASTPSSRTCCTSSPRCSA